MTLTCMLLALWLMLQLPIALLIGKAVRLGSGGKSVRRPEIPTGVVWC